MNTQNSITVLEVKIIEVKDEKIRFSKRALDKDPLDWCKENNKKVGDIITTRIHEVMKTGVKVSIDTEKKIIVSIRKADLAKSSADARPEVFSPGNALDAKITELDIVKRKIDFSPYKMGWSFDIIYTALSFIMKRPVLRDYAHTIDHPQGTNYNKGIAEAEMHNFYQSLPEDLQKPFGMIKGDRYQLVEYYKK